MANQVQLHVSDDAPQPQRLYFPAEYTPGRWIILYEYIEGTVEENGEVFDLAHIRIHYGRRTGQPVRFSRLSDAERLCNHLNGETPL